MQRNAEATDVLWVATGSKPNAVAGAIAGFFRERGGCCSIRAIGIGAVDKMVRALVLARSYLLSNSHVSWCAAAFVDVEVDATEGGSGSERTALQVSIERCRIPSLAQSVRLVRKLEVGGEEDTGSLAGSLLDHLRRCAQQDYLAQVEVSNQIAANQTLKALARATNDVVASGVVIRFYMTAPNGIDVWPLVFTCFYVTPQILEET